MSNLRSFITLEKTAILLRIAVHQINYELTFNALNSSINNGITSNKSPTIP